MRHCIKLDGILKSKNYEPILNRINGTCFILKDLYVYTDSWNVKVFSVELEKVMIFNVICYIKQKYYIGVKIKHKTKIIKD